MKRPFGGKRLAILVGGGPAPGINGVIRAVTLESRKLGFEVLGIYDGFQWISQGVSSQVEVLSIENTSRIHYRGGSILRTSRVNPTTSETLMSTTLKTLADLGITYLVTIGGDDTATSAMKLAESAQTELHVVHVPKTIDNDLPLPAQMPTFGYQTARHVGANIVRAMMVDAETSCRWFFIVSMGRKAGHLALGIGKAAGATLTIIGEEFRNEVITFQTLCDILEGAVIKRLVDGRAYGVAMLAEGLLERIDRKEIEKEMTLERDAHGNIRLSELELGRPLKNAVHKRLTERGINVTIVNKDLGYEVRCADPIPYDLEYTQDLGFAAVQHLISRPSASMISLDRGRGVPISLVSLRDPKTGKTRIREVNIDSDSYKASLRYMIRLEKSDFETPERIARLALHGNLEPEEFEKRFRYVTYDPPVRR